MRSRSTRNILIKGQTDTSKDCAKSKSFTQVFHIAPIFSHQRCSEAVKAPKATILFQQFWQLHHAPVLLSTRVGAYRTTWTDVPIKPRSMKSAGLSPRRWPSSASPSDNAWLRGNALGKTISTLVRNKKRREWRRILFVWFWGRWWPQALPLSEGEIRYELWTVVWKLEFSQGIISTAW